MIYRPFKSVGNQHKLSNLQPAINYTRRSTAGSVLGKCKDRNYSYPCSLATGEGFFIFTVITVVKPHDFEDYFKIILITQTSCR